MASQALETVIGLSFFLGVVAISASALVETWARILRRRSRRLRKSLDNLMEQWGTDLDLAALEITAAYQAEVGSLTHSGWLGWITDKLRLTPRPSYLERETVARAVLEKLDHTAPGKGMLKSLDVDRMRAEILSSYDAAMAQASDAYKRWTTPVLFIASLGLCAIANLSVLTVGERLWDDNLAREAVIEDLQNGEDPAPITLTDSTECRNDSAQPAADVVAVPTGVPVGWRCDPREYWDALDDGERGLLVGGWLITAFLSMVGGQSWFDLAGRLIKLRPASAPLKAKA